MVRALRKPQGANHGKTYNLLLITYYSHTDSTPRLVITSMLTPVVE